MISTSPRYASTQAGTNTTASRRTCPGGVRAGLARLAAARDGGERLADAHDEAHLSAAEEQKRVTYAGLELHRRNPILHLGELDLAGYDRDYAPQPERDAARAEHLAAWPGWPTRPSSRSTR